MEEIRRVIGDFHGGHSILGQNNGAGQPSQFAKYLQMINKKQQINVYPPEESTKDTNPSMNTISAKTDRVTRAA
jgi:hypothetical protein